MPRQPAVAAAWLSGSAGILTLGATLVCAGSQCSVPQFDSVALGLLNDWKSNGLDTFFATITWLGSLWVLVPIAVLIAWKEYLRSSWRTALFVPLSLLLASSLAHITKTIVERPRPELYPASIPVPVDWSFPSAHTMQVTACLLAMLLLHRTGSLFAQILGAAAVILLVMVSRAYLQVHFPTDIVFGLVAAIACVIAAQKLTLDQRRVS
ncbi:MAG: phosphoesterase pA-phosphatase-like protein [Proteobacteria bacterium]|nr:phosphoesterase pA-phosphatase-like protein [Pseudomonadota bacterium]